MNTATSPISRVPGVSYATQLAQASALKRSLSNLGIAIQKGELVPASTILAAFFKANPQYTSSSDDDSQSPDSLSEDFQALATALSNNQVGAAQTAWTQVKSGLAKDGVTDLGHDAPTPPPAQTKALANDEIPSEVLGDSHGGALIAPLVGGSDSASDQTGLPGAQIEHWVTYEQVGTTASPATNSGSGSLLDTAA